MITGIRIGHPMQTPFSTERTAPPGSSDCGSAIFAPWDYRRLEQAAKR
jgi:hypothetical protein